MPTLDLRAIPTTTDPSSLAALLRRHPTALGTLGAAALAAVALAACSQASTDESAAVEGPTAVAAEASQTPTTCITIQRGGTGSVADALINAGQPDKTYGATGSLSAGMTSGTQRQGLLKFDLSMLLPGTVVGSATLNLNAYLPSGTAKPVRIHRALSPWSESTVTWNTFAGSYASTVEAQIQPAAAFTWVATDVTALVQQWVSGAAPNHGMVLERDLDGTTVYGTSESPQLPSLQVCYTPPFCQGKADGTACDDGDGCTTGDACQGQVCVGSALPSVACNTGLPGVCATGATSCSGGAVHCDQTVFPSSETCNGLDDDCDGTVDDGAAASCPGGANATAICSSGACGLSCGAGFGDCDGNAGNGCETSLSTSANCGGCGVSCGGGVCSNGACLTGASCATILAANPGAPSGLYTIDPDGAGGASAFQVYCDMSSAGGGWTLVMKAIDSNFDYDDAVWTTANTLNPTDFDFASAGKLAKYPSFNTVPFTQLKTSYTTDFTNAYTWTAPSSYGSALALFSASSGIQISTSFSTYFDNIVPANWREWGCTTYINVGINQRAYLGTAFIGGGSYCDWNGGARFGQRVNSYHGGTGNHAGEGWGAYTTISGFGQETIRQLLWVR